MTLSANQILGLLRTSVNYNGVFIPEFTWGVHRIDAIIVDIRSRWVRGFEIKVTRGDFNRDQKWPAYTQFLSALSIVCPWRLITAEEVDDPVGLLWVSEDAAHSFQWAKRPRRFQQRGSVAWLWTYLKVIEAELPRLEAENMHLRQALSEVKQRQEAAP